MATSPAAASPALELMLMQAIAEIRAGKLVQAERTVDQMIALAPNYRLAHLIKGDLLLARSRAITGLGNVPEHQLSAQVVVPTPFPARRPQLQSAAEALDELRSEALARVTSRLDTATKDRLPEGLWRIAGDMPHVIVVDARRSRLHVFENRHGRLQPIADFYASVGKLGVGKAREGDRKTPTGTYILTGQVPRERLNDFYGSGAFELDFPNAWDQRMGRTGSGIWLHGTPPSTFARAPRASDGCIVVSNADLATLSRYIVPGRTPFIVAESLVWVDRETLARHGQALLTAIERWRDDFVSGDGQRIARHYHGATIEPRRNAAGRVVPVSKTRPAMLPAGPVAITNLSAMAVAGEPGVALVVFDRALGTHRDRVRQYWQWLDGRWRIMHESASLP
ncbi:MAG: murein L,D-transpeptidase family protein [Casimicrobiaceae bacterium]